MNSFFTEGISNKSKPFIPNEENITQNNKDNFFTNSHPEIYIDDLDKTNDWDKFNISNGGDFFTAKLSNNFRRNYSRGKSFKFSVWNESDTYNNDEFVVDFVQWDKSLWAAKKTSTNIVPSEGDYWELIVKGVSDIEFRQIDNRIEYRYKDPTSEWEKVFELVSVSEDQIKKMLEDLEIKGGNTYDTGLSETFINDVQNQAIAKKFKEYELEITELQNVITTMQAQLASLTSN